MRKTPRFPPEIESGIVDGVADLLRGRHTDLRIFRRDGRLEDVTTPGIHVGENFIGDPLVHMTLPGSVRWFSAIVSATSVLRRDGDPSTTWACDLVWQTKPGEEGPDAVQVRSPSASDLASLMDMVSDLHLEFANTDSNYAFRHR
jgi:hypothetical protein